MKKKKIPQDLLSDECRYGHGAKTQASSPRKLGSTYSMSSQTDSFKEEAQLLPSKSPEMFQTCEAGTVGPGLC